MESEIYGDFRFFVKNGCLKRVENVADSKRDLVIPRSLPKLGEIKSIGEDFLYGVFNKVSIDDQISKVYPKAFAYSSVKEVVWPAACDYIPAQCFMFSDIQSIKNIEQIKEIHALAFADTFFLPIDLSGLMTISIEKGAFAGKVASVILPYYLAGDDACEAFMYPDD